MVELETLRDTLRALPAVCASTPLLWVPRSVRAPMAAALRQLLSTATRLASAPEGNCEAEVAHLLLRNAPYILLRGHPEGSDDTEDAAPAARIVELVRQRLRMARAGS